MKRLFFFLLTIFFLSANATLLFAQTYFDDSDSLKIVMGNSTAYELALSKKNGAILYLTDKTANVRLSEGSYGDNLWLLKSGDTKIGAADYSSAKPDSFYYSYFADSSVLKLYYTPKDETVQPRVTVTIRLTDDAYFDMVFEVANKTNLVFHSAHFPERLLIPTAEIFEALMPDKPGVILETDFFTDELPKTGQYILPHPPAFADFFAVKEISGQLAIYSVWTPGPIRQNELGFQQIVADTTMAVHNFNFRVAPGKSWLSPPVRLRIGQDFSQCALAYREDNRLDDFESVSEKLGAKYTDVLQSVLMHLDPQWVDKGFKDWPEIFRQLPSPSVLMPSDYWPGGFHGSHPDYIPPDPAYGTTAELKAAVDSAHALGMLVMPLTLPVWWHENSPTVRNLAGYGLDISDVARLDSSGNPEYTAWELAGQYDWGYNVSPRQPYVQQRLSEFMAQMSDSLGYDMIYEDVLGASSYGEDFQPSVIDSFDPEGWIDHTRAYKDHLLCTENGYDHLAETEFAFLGGGFVPGWDSTEPGKRLFPLVEFLLHDKVLFYNYWGDPSTSAGRLSWDLLFGYMLNNAVKPIDDGVYTRIGSPWQYVNAYFQKYVLSRYADEPLTAFSRPGSDALQCTYESVTVTANKSFSASFTSGAYTIPPQGVLVQSTGGDLTAGIFSTYNNRPLSAGDHYLIERRFSDSLEVRQPLGSDTDLLLTYLPGWSQSDTTLWVKAYSAETLVSVFKPQMTASGLIFNYRQSIDGQHINDYRVIKSDEQPQTGWTTFFDDYDIDVMTVGNRSVYELGLNKNRGELKYILDKSSGDTLSLGSQWSRLWALTFPQAPNPDVAPDMVGFWPDGANDFKYQWNPESNELKLFYRGDTSAAQYLNVTATITVSPNSWFDVRLKVTNHWGYDLQRVAFPNNLRWKIAAGDKLLLPFSYPGIQFNGVSLLNGQAADGYYPGDFHAGLSVLAQKNSYVSVYSLHSDSLRPEFFGWMPFDDPLSSANVVSEREYPVFVKNGADWTSPRIRFRLGENFKQAILDYRNDNGIDGYPSLRSKVAASAQKLFQSPLYYLEYEKNILTPFAEYADSIQNYPNPALVCLSGFQTGGRYGNHPDYLPPDDRWGSQENLKQFITALHSQGKWVMPFIAPMWWNENSPTVQNISDISAVAQLNPEGQPERAQKDSYRGYYVCPYAPQVQSKLSTVFDELKRDMGFDMMFEAEIGSRSAETDKNAAEPAPTAYDEGWLEHTHVYRDSLLIVQGGYDRLAANVIGFTGTVYSDGPSEWDNRFGAGNWQPYPMATYLYHDKILQYAPLDRQTGDQQALAWNLFYGMQLNGTLYDTDNPERLGHGWFNVLNLFQKYVGSELAGQTLTEFKEIDTDVLQNSFADFSVVRNNTKSGYAVGEQSVSAQGILVAANDGHLLAGIFDELDGQALTGSDHFLIARTFADSILVYQPKGKDTNLRVPRPADWDDSTRIKIAAVGATFSEDVDVTLSSDYIGFRYSAKQNGEPVECYKIEYGSGTGIEGNEALPKKFAMFQNYPNPFNPSTTIHYQLPREDKVELTVYNMLGQKVRTLVDRKQQAGNHSIVFDGRSLSSGIYYYKLKVGSGLIRVRKMVLIK